MIYNEFKDAFLPSQDAILDTLLNEYWVQAENIGVQFIQELVETLYDTVPVQLRNTSHRTTSSFVNGDSFSLFTLLPASQHIRRIIIVVDSFFFHSMNCVPPSDALPLQDTPNAYQAWVVECLQLLEGTVNKKCKFVVQVTETRNYLTRVLLYVGPRLRIMKDAGFEVEVCNRRGEVC
jgi:hypothetical protein